MPEGNAGSRIAIKDGSSRTPDGRAVYLAADKRVRAIQPAGEQAFRAFYRVDGQAVPRAALTPFKGSNTLSPFVVLATRA